MPRKKLTELQDVSVIVTVMSGVIDDVLVYKNPGYARKEYYRLLAHELELDEPTNLSEELEIDEMWEAVESESDNGYSLIETKVRI